MHIRCGICGARGAPPRHKRDCSYRGAGFINVADIVDESTGLTPREANAQKTHSIPVGSLVEIMCSGDDIDMDGVRAYVVHHGRDCDQTPLYYVSMDRYDTQQTLDGFRNATWRGGYTEESLRLVVKRKRRK